MNRLSSLAFGFSHFVIASILIFLTFMREYFWVDYLYGEGVYLIVLILLVSYIGMLMIAYTRTRTLGEDFEQVKDLVRGTIFTDLRDLWAAY